LMSGCGFPRSPARCGISPVDQFSHSRSQNPNAPCRMEILACGPPAHSARESGNVAGNCLMRNSSDPENRRENARKPAQGADCSSRRKHSAGKLGLLSGREWNERPAGGLPNEPAGINGMRSKAPRILGQETFAMLCRSRAEASQCPPGPVPPREFGRSSG